MKLVVGLGNPGKQYEHTRHNMGYDVIDVVADMASIDIDRTLFKGIYGICNNPVFPDKFILCKPETFMNLSGECVSQMMSYFKISIDDLLVVYDDMSIPVGKIKLKPGGSSGSHKGIGNIIQMLGSEKIKRIKIGIGEPEYSSIDFVLSKPSEQERPLIAEAISNGAKAVKEFLINGFDAAMNQFNKS